VRQGDLVRVKTKHHNRFDTVGTVIECIAMFSGEPGARVLFERPVYMKKLHLEVISDDK
jgi:hypothetical protein